MSNEILLTIIAVLVLLGLGVAIWILWNQAIYEGNLKQIAAAMGRLQGTEEERNK